jgi:DNA ligase 1
MNFEYLASCFSKVEETSSQNEMIATLARLLTGAEPGDIETVCYFTLGRIAPGFTEATLGIGERAAARAIALAAEVDPAAVEAEARKVGDYGDVASRLIGPPRRMFEDTFPVREPLTVADVLRGFNEIAGARGPGSAEQKAQILAAMLSVGAPRDRRYLARLATGEMRLGVGDMSLLDALALGYLGSKAERSPLEEAYNICSDIGLVARCLREYGLSGVRKISVALHRPIKPMLTQRVSGIGEIMKRIGSRVIGVEEKYDGERIQAHKDGDNVTLFSRRLTNVTRQFPDIVEHVAMQVRADSAILDGEAVAFDHSTGRFQPFQDLMRRRRKYRVREYALEIPATYKVFDLLYLEGESYLRRTYPERRAALEEILSEEEHIALADRIVTADPGEIEAFYRSCIRRGLEGVVCKSCASDSYYRAGAREWQWIKWKKTYGTELSDTLDLVIVGASAGRGKRAGTYGSVLCAAYNHDEDIFQTVCGMGTGFSDKELARLPERLADARIDRPAARVMVTGQVRSDFWFTPRHVLEVLGLEITESPVHTCNWDPERQRGLALRFPRFVRWRDEKAPEQATTTGEIASMFRRQRGK